LKRYRTADAEAVLEALDESRSTLTKWLSSIGRRRSIGELPRILRRLERHWENGGRLDYAVPDRWSGRFLGEAGLYEIDWQRRVGEVGYWLESVWVW
jgi:RimJ/RimL family protein N-acetyltransferase